IEITTIARHSGQIVYVIVYFVNNLPFTRFPWENALSKQSFVCAFSLKTLRSGIQGRYGFV
ncbi:MAG: hypothetical protein V3V37_03585, partial [Candidatus Adiutricales bacterium]